MGTIPLTMYRPWQLALKYLDYFLKSSNGRGHGIHSPFIFQFITGVLNDKHQYGEYKIVENLRKQLLNDRTKLAIRDFGAGSNNSKKTERSVSEIARHSAKSRKFAQLLFRLVRKYHPETIIELGTSLGITSSYLSLAGPEAEFYTIEGSGEIAAIAVSNFKKLKLEKINSMQGNFDTVLPEVLSRVKKVDFAFIDGNHQLQPTLDYFEQLLPMTGNHSILVFDDIHWSQGMEKAWTVIKAHPAVQCTVDLFFIGLVFFREEFREKQHFTIRF